MDHCYVSTYPLPSCHLNASLGVRHILGKDLAVSFFVNNRTAKACQVTGNLAGASPGTHAAGYAARCMYGIRVRFGF